MLLKMADRRQREIIISGFGGQGILFLGKFIASIAMEQGHNVTYIPSYGVEVRGGTANCTVIYSNDEIASPVTVSPTTVFAMNTPSVLKFCPLMREKGLLLYNSSLVAQEPEREDVMKLAVPANDLAESSGSRKAANIVMLGAYTARENLAAADKICRKLEQALSDKPELAEINIRAFLKGNEYAGGEG